MPRKKFKTQSADKANSMYILTAQKKEIKNYAQCYLVKFTFCIGLFIMCVVIASTQERTSSFDVLIFILVPCVSIYSVVCTFKSIGYFVILRALNRIQSESEETVKIECKDVRFITYNCLKYAYSVILIIIFVGTDHKKYLYVLPEHVGNYKKTRQHMIDKCLYETFEFTCYTGTKMIKHFDIWDGYR